MNISDWLALAQESLKNVSSSFRLDTEIILSHTLGKPRTWILTHPNVEISPEILTIAEGLLSRAKASEPIPYIIGHWEFYGLDFLVSKDVLIPRPETELIVDQALGWLHSHPDQKRVADIGTGCGCIAISLAKALPRLEIFATDITKSALEIALQNCIKHQAKNIKFRNFDLIGNQDFHFDVICANLPYIPTSTLDTLVVSQFEPRSALDGGKDGLREISRLLDAVHNNKPLPSLILCEIEASQKQSALEISQRFMPSSKVTVLRDLAGMDRLLRIECENENAYH
jgi:release factor glutamine methyltransferase